MNLTEIKKICEKYGIRPSKSLGQNFLFDQNIIKKIFSEADISKVETVLEVGPGIGVLTEGLIQRAKRVVAVELDAKAVNFLKSEFFNEKNFDVFQRDILKINRNELALQNFRYKVVSNLPYNITSKFLRLFLEQEPKPSEMILMVQKEVAQRIVAKPGEMSLLSLSCQFYSNPKILFYVSKGSFWPEPDVDSAVIRLELKKMMPSVDEKKLFQIARMGFSSKRKQLHNNLSAGLKISSEDIKSILKSLEFDEKIRAQDLSMENWIELSHKI